jgi:hypothetical protein
MDTMVFPPQCKAANNSTTRICLHGGDKETFITLYSPKERCHYCQKEKSTKIHTHEKKQSTRKRQVVPMDSERSFGSIPSLGSKFLLISNHNTANLNAVESE